MRDYRMPYISVVKRTPQPPKVIEQPSIPDDPSKGRELTLVLNDVIKLAESFGDSSKAS